MNMIILEIHIILLVYYSLYKVHGPMLGLLTIRVAYTVACRVAESISDYYGFP